MAYEKLNLADGDVFAAEHVAHMESGIEAAELGSYVISREKLGIDNTGATDVTLLLQAAIDEAYAGGYKRVEFEPGTYLISTQKEISSGNNPFCGGLELHSNTEYDFCGAVLKLAATKSIGYNMLMLEYAENVTVRNVELFGDRIEHDYTTYSNTHEFGYGVGQYSSKNVLYDNIVVHDCTGDGIYWGFGNDGSDKWTAEYYNYDCTIRNSEFYNIRRNGLSPCCNFGLTLDNVHIHDIGTTVDGIAGTAPKMGIDMEPYTNYEWVENVFIRNTLIEKTAAYPIGIPKAVNVRIEGCKLVTDEENRQAIYVSDRTVTTVHVKDTQFVGFKGQNGYIDSYENCDMGGAEFFAATNQDMGSISERTFFAKNCINVGCASNHNYEISKIKNAIITNCEFVEWFPVNIFAENVVIDGCVADDPEPYYINCNADHLVISNSTINLVKKASGEVRYGSGYGNEVLFTDCKIHVRYDEALASDFDFAVCIPAVFESCEFICEGAGVRLMKSARNCHFTLLPSNNTLFSNAIPTIEGDEAYNCVFDASDTENQRMQVGIGEQYRCVWKINHSSSYLGVGLTATTKMVQNVFENIGAVEAKLFPNYNAAFFTVTDHGSLWINCAMSSY